MTKEQYAHIGQKYGLNGEFSYINPKKESLGVKYTPEGGGPAQLVNPPGLDGGDVVNFLMQEAPALAGEFALARLFPWNVPLKTWVYRYFKCKNWKKLQDNPRCLLLVLREEILYG
jgi:hypothetical protein